MRRRSWATWLAGGIVLIAVLAACTNRIFNQATPGSGETRRIQVGELVDGSVLY